jgi:ribonuclease HI
MPLLLNIFCDGASRGNPGPAAAAFIIQDKAGHLIHQESKYLGTKTNNFAEYTAVLLAHTWLYSHQENFSKAKAIFYLDSELVVKQLTGHYKVKSKALLPLVVKIKNLSRGLNLMFSYNHVFREKNSRADSLANQEIDRHVS